VGSCRALGRGEEVLACGRVGRRLCRRGDSFFWGFKLGVHALLMFMFEL
jgi:hypothetical protein